MRFTARSVAAQSADPDAARLSMPACCVGSAPVRVKRLRWSNPISKLLVVALLFAAIDLHGSTTNHWAFQPVRKVSLPKVKSKSWGNTPVDRFILARLEANRLAPTPPTDRRTLIRRATFDLHGLPPTPDEVQTFVRDPAPTGKAFAARRRGER
jgi:Protein of unknown function (DUF1549)